MEYKEGNFQGNNDLSLYYQGWLPENEVKAVLLVVHGLAEHSGRYMNLVNYFVPMGYAVYGFDQRGHGKSPGLRCYVERFPYFLTDLEAFCGVVRWKHPDAGIFLLGHSVGGTIAVAYTVSHQDELAGLILSGATLKVGDSISPGAITAARALSLLLPKMGVDVIDASAVSRDKAVVAAYVNDPLVYRGKIRARLGAELIKTIQSLPGQMKGISLPILIMHGTADRLSEPEGSRMLHEGVSSKDRTLKLYDGFYHEIFNEPGHQQVFGDMEGWLGGRV